ncbi:3-deoxy-D-manno-octulosonic-acid transferase [Bathymodiolus platifrons methanotrophic gill symbiont]|nr:lipid IV(A) 3-deoxy-D-manno-octulosonic acid transferase [Bathymodiolus platifrons methanotrophic gill symbiont]MCK5869205.1 lipid IV(A) 3-deoxy-D-manno-octulosonic acid transferase [Methyloprofundus sp.]TXK96642.1 3-deoxy-D-manno-octulosonic acid transferase [Methylococcaceae bacterium CS4]TXK99840.1 3-deoxy-D-manno-octulosonic acid transferase [Methylococcaceae bacterium CS5]TXL06466.1 3-deoxy-D-manno-octulosonic acid transferase [Methylococcaceae bacterium CS1]TXL07226.1 3-deoxy-D-manno-
MYYFYVALFYLLIPFWAVFHYLRGLNKKDYHARWKEFFGFYTKKHTQQVIWLHAASVGEVEAANVLINYFRDNSSYKVLVTTSTEPGYQRVHALQGDRVEHVYLPLDIPDAVGRFVRHFQPRMAVIMETEIWPVLISKCAENSIPFFIVNARLSEKSTKGYLKFKFFLENVFSGVNAVIVQTELDARRYQDIGVSAEKITVTGNIKLDMAIPESTKIQAFDIKQKLFPERMVLVVGSTHQGEEEIFLNGYKSLKQRFPELLLVLVPRQPKRTDEIIKLCLVDKLNVVRRTEERPCTASTDVFLVDTIGELKQMYAVADCSFVAGSMVPIGGHNIFEPILLDVPVLFGPYMKNSEMLAQQLLDAKGAIQCFNDADIVDNVTLILSQTREKELLINAGRAFVKQNRGALERTVAVIENFMRERKPRHLRD